MGFFIGFIMRIVLAVLIISKIFDFRISQIEEIRDIGEFLGNVLFLGIYIWLPIAIIGFFIGNNLYEKRINRFK